MEKVKNKIIIISGPTASYKTATAIRIATELKFHNSNFEIVNFDSLLFYRELNIGTASLFFESFKVT